MEDADAAEKMNSSTNPPSGCRVALARKRLLHGVANVQPVHVHCAVTMSACASARCRAPSGCTAARLASSLSAALKHLRHNPTGGGGRGRRSPLDSFQSRQISTAQKIALTCAACNLREENPRSCCRSAHPRTARLIVPFRHRTFATICSCDAALGSARVAVDTE